MTALEGLLDEHMMESKSPIEMRRSRDLRLVDGGGTVRAYPDPHRTPVLPPGWAPLSREQQDAVVEACEDAPGSMIVRLGSLLEPGTEYRVYRLANELWGGLSVITKALAEAEGGRRLRPAANVQLLGLAWDTPRAVRIALDFFNWDLEAQGQEWRLHVVPGA